MSNRYGYGDGRADRDDPYGEYGDWDNRRRSTRRASSGAGAYRNEPTGRRTVSYRGEDAEYSSSRRSSASRTRSSRDWDPEGSYRSHADARSTHRDAESRSTDRRRVNSGYGVETSRHAHAEDIRANARRSSRTSEPYAVSHRSASAARSRVSEGDNARQVGERTRSLRQTNEATTSRFSRSSYGSGEPRRREAASQRTSSVNAHAARSGAVGRYESAEPIARETASARRSNAGRNAKIVVVAVLLIALIGGVAAFGYINSITGALHEGVDDDLRASLVKTDMANEPFYMLLLGTDKISWREGTEEGGMYRSDTMILARVDAPQGTITLISIPRDTLVNIEGYGWQKINAAYGLGGPSLAVDTVSKMTGVDISHYAEIDMDGLSAIVDAIGGVEVEVPIEIDDEDAGGYVPAGLQTLDGEHALIVCRSRNSYAEVSAAPDLMRAANQRLVLSAIAHKVLGSDVATIANTVRSAAQYVMTDLELNDIIGLAQAMQGMDTGDSFYTASLPTGSAYIVNGYAYPDMYTPTPIEAVDPSVIEGWYCLVDTDAWSVMKGRMAEGQPPAEGVEIDEATGTILSTAGSDAIDVSTKNAWVTVMNGTDRDGLATRAMGLLNAAGFENITIEDGYFNSNYPETLVIYNESGRAHEADQIVGALGQGRAMMNDGNWVVANNFLVVIGDDWKSTSSSASSSSASASSAGATR